MNRSGNELLACAGLAENEHTGSRHCYALHVAQQILDDFAAANDLVEVMDRLQLIFQILRLLGQLLDLPHRFMTLVHVAQDHCVKLTLVRG